MPHSVTLITTIAAALGLALIFRGPKASASHGVLEGETG